MSQEPKATLKIIPLSSIKESAVALRSVNVKDLPYQELVSSVRDRGVLNPILVREVLDVLTGEMSYGLVDGLQRYRASKDAGRNSIPAQVLSLTDAEVLEAQIITNIHRIETKPIQYTQQLIRVLSSNPLMTLSSLAVKLSKSPSWVIDRLSLDNLDKPIGDLVDDDKVSLSNAYALAKLSTEEQKLFIDRAMIMPPSEFLLTVNSRIAEIRTAKRQGRDASGPTWNPVPHLQKLGAIGKEYENSTIGAALLSENHITDAMEAWKMALAWVRHLDPFSVAVAKAADEKRREELETAKLKRKAERAQVLLAEVAAVGAGIQSDE